MVRIIRRSKLKKLIARELKNKFLFLQKKKKNILKFNQRKKANTRDNFFFVVKSFNTYKLNLKITQKLKRMENYEALKSENLKKFNFIISLIKENAYKIKDEELTLNNKFKNYLKILEVNQSSLKKKKFNINSIIDNKNNLLKKGFCNKLFFKPNYRAYLMSLNGKNTLYPYSSGNYIINLLPKVKFIFKEYYFFLKKKKKKKRYKELLYEYDFLPLVNLLKKKEKFQEITRQFLKGCRIYFKFTGSNMFGTITNTLGEVLFSYSAGIFKNTRTRKEKTTIFIAKQLGELIALRLYKSNASEIVFIPFMNHRKARSLMKFLGSGFRLIKFFELSKFIVTRRVMRNGVRLRKLARK